MYLWDIFSHNNFFFPFTFFKYHHQLKDMTFTIRLSFCYFLFVYFISPSWVVTQLLFHRQS